MTLHTDDYLDAEEDVLDMMQANTAHLVANMTTIGEREFDMRAAEGINEYEKFMEMGVVISVNETTDDNAPPLVGVGVNGDVRWLPRGPKIRLPRKFLEVLAKAQERKIKSERNPDPGAEEGMNIKKRNAQAYSFSVIHDPHPKGRAWLERITRQGC